MVYALYTFEILASDVSKTDYFREYKEALRQQRNQDSTAIYRPKDQQTTTPDGIPSNLDSPTSTFPSTKYTLSATSSSNTIQGTHTLSQLQYQSSSSPSFSNGGSGGGDTPELNTISNKAYRNSIDLNNGVTSPNKNDKPVQKVTPSRNTTPIKYQHNANTPANWQSNGNQPIGEVAAIITKENSTYVKPNSPSTAATIGSLGYNSVPSAEKLSKVTNKNGPKSNRYAF